MRRRTVLKQFGAGALPAIPAPAPGPDSPTIDAYVYVDQPPDAGNDLAALTAECERALDALLSDVEATADVSFTHRVHDRWRRQTAYPRVPAGDMAGWQSWLWEQGHREGANDGSAAYHMLVCPGSDGTYGGQSSGVIVFTGDRRTYVRGGIRYKVPRGMCTVAAPNLEAWMTFAHEMGHSLMDWADVPEIRSVTHSCCEGGGCSDECPLCDKSTTGCRDAGEAIHHPEHTLGTVVDGGKTVMAHRSHTAAECDGGTGADGEPRGCGVGGDAACGTGFTLAVSECTAEAIRLTANAY
jgi:hypothetical protein